MPNSEKLINPSIVGKWIKVKPIHCHQRLKKNQLVDMVKTCSDDGKWIEVKFRFDYKKLDFFFDHKIDHLPGMLEVNCMRQLSLAVAHLIFKVPMTYVALLDWLKVRFYSYGALNLETFAKVRLIKSKFFTEFRKMYIFSGVMYQGKTKLMRVDGKLIMMHPTLASKIRHMKILMGNWEQEPFSNDFNW